MLQYKTFFVIAKFNNLKTNKTTKSDKNTTKRCHQSRKLEPPICVKMEYILIRF